MVDIALKSMPAKRSMRDTTAWDRCKVNREWLGFWFMLPAMGFLILFLAYPLGLGIWMSFTDIRIGRRTPEAPFGRLGARGIELRREYQHMRRRLDAGSLP